MTIPKPLGLEFIKLGLNDVLYDTKTKEFYTPNTNQHAKMGENPLQNAEKDDTIQNRDYIQDPETGLMMGSTSEGGESSSDLGGGDSEESSKSKPRKIGTVDFKDKDAVTAVIRDFESRHAEADIEHCIVVTTQGEVYEIDGKQWTVDTTVLGDKMKGSINSHNHVTGESRYSFSIDDIKSSVGDGSYRVEGFDEKYRYSMVIERKISKATVYDAYVESKLEVDGIMMADYFEGKVSIPDEDIRHEVIKRTCKRVGIIYEREKKE